MSFRIGQRVTSHFTGEGTIQSDILPREESTDDKQQIVQFDSTLLGTRPWAIMKLDRVGDEVTEVTGSPEWRLESTSYGVLKSEKIP
jgi:hypothetical protein